MELLATCEIERFDAQSDLCLEESVTAPFVLCPDGYTLVDGSKKDQKDDKKKQDRLL